MPLVKREVEAMATIPPMKFRRFIDTIAVYLDSLVPRNLRAAPLFKQGPPRGESGRLLSSTLRTVTVRLHFRQETFLDSTKSYLDTVSRETMPCQTGSSLLGMPPECKAVSTIG
jgi:hypothetical protein